MWFFFAISSAFLYAFRGVLEKKIILDVNKYILGLAIRLFALPFFFIPFLINPALIGPITHLNTQFWIAIVAICFISTPLETVLYYQALKDEEITLVLPILSLAPAITMVFGLLIFHEVPNAFGVLGVLAIIFGIYALKIGHAKEGLLQPFHHLRNNKSVRLMTIVMLSQGIGTIFDKMGVTNSNAFFYSVVNYLGVCLALLVIAYIKAKPHFRQLILYKKQFFIIGAFVAGYTLFYTLALQTGFAAYVISIKNSSILLTMVLGYLFLKEKNLKTKLFAASFIVLGLIFIKVFN
jgi:drug/metabolite transporter (DMT)-like permease